MNVDANFRRFVKESGFKVLALARLSQCEYSIMLYLLNCVVSGLDQFITTESELASLIGHDDETLRGALGELAAKNLIRLHYGDSANSNDPDNASLRIGLQYDMTKWTLAYDADVTSQDAIVFPFRRQTGPSLQVLDGQKKEKTKKADNEASTAQRVLDSYTQFRALEDDEKAQTAEAAHMLVETHPVDQVLLMIRHFGRRIPTLSLLASSWQHYQEIFEAETQKVDMGNARLKHEELDQRVRDQASQLLSRREDAKLTEEEVTVLQILTKHRHPRRQLFWAYQLRSRYPNLSGFFADNVGLMLSVTTSGAVIRRPQD